jgi:hypothetical protein
VGVTGAGDGKYGKQIYDRRQKAIPLKRLGLPGIVAFLANDDANFITGQTISVSGGAKRRLAKYGSLAASTLQNKRCCLFAELHACMRRHARALLAGVLTYGFRKTGGRFSRKALTPSRDSFVS